MAFSCLFYFVWQKGGLFFRPELEYWWYFDSLAWISLSVSTFLVLVGLVSWLNIVCASDLFCSCRKTKFCLWLVVPQVGDLILYWAKAFRPNVYLNHKEFSSEFELLKLKMLHSLSFKNPNSWPWQGVSTQSSLIRATGTSNQKELWWKAYKNLFFFLLQIALSQAIWNSCFSILSVSYWEWAKFY